MKEIYDIAIVGGGTAGIYGARAGKADGAVAATGAVEFLNK